MLDPSSSEEESDEGLEEQRQDLLGVSGGSGPSNSCSPRALPAASRDSGRQDGSSSGGGPTRPVSPSPSLRSEGREEQERLLREEREKRLRLQLYAFIVRCIAYPFNAKQPTDMARRQQKLNKQQLQVVKERFQAFLNGETQIVADEAFAMQFEVTMK